MLKRLLLTLTALAILLGGVFAVKHRQAQDIAAQRAVPPPPAGVAVTEVQAEAWQPRLRAVGSIVATQGIFVTNEVAGQVREILFDSGHAVAQGDLLLQLDDSVDQAELRGLIAERNLADIKLQRVAKLLRDRSVSQSDYDEAKAEVDGTEAQVASKQALIGKKQIRAPFAGQLGIRNVDLGEYLPPGSQIVPLNALDPVFVDYALPERHFSTLSVGQAVEVRVAAHPEDTFQGQISAINPGVERSTRTVRVRATLANPRQLLRPGMFAEVATLLPARDGVLTLPRTAITYNPYGDSVFLLQEEEGALTVQLRQVTTGEAQGGRVEVTTGLAKGDRVVIAGQVKLRHAQSVAIDNAVVPDQEAVSP
jgi:membrane fusion protein (multidrug efflux system)